jgi:hypothetical protein
MPRGDVAGAGSGPERRSCDHSICLFELWSQEISRSGTSAYYRETLTGAMIAKPLTYDEHKAAEAAFRGYPPNDDWTDSAHEIYVRLSAAIAKRRATAFDQTNECDLEEATR